MSLIPLDDRRGDGQPPSREGVSEPGVLGRLWNRVRSLLSSVADHTSDHRHYETESVLALPDGADPHPDGGVTGRGDSEPLELVCTETDDRLTVSVADNPDATITSDTWVPVER